jgi:hypothetical protein
MKRRIICDRTEPHCKKCHKKGLECTGFGIRYRFNNGIASRGQFKGKKQPTTENQSGISNEDNISNTASFRQKHLVWLNELSPVAPLKETDILQGGSDSPMTAWLDVEGFGNESSGRVELTAFEDDVVEKTLVLYEPIQLLDSKTRFLFSHCTSTSKSHYIHIS